MQYKTIILEWLQDRPEYHEPLRRSGRLLEVMEKEAGRLKNLHEDIVAIMTRKSPEVDRVSAKQAALEVALYQWQEEFQSRVSSNDSDKTPLSGAGTPNGDSQTPE